MPFYPRVSQDATLSGIARDGGVEHRLERFDVTSSLTPDRQKSHTGSFIFTACICPAGLDPSSRTMKPQQSTKKETEKTCSNRKDAGSQRVAVHGSVVSQAARIHQQKGLVPGIDAGAPHQGYIQMNAQAN